MIAITGATGQLGRMVIAALRKTLPANQIIAAVRNPHKAADLAAQGVVVRHADYLQPDTLAPAFAGADKLLLISSSDLGQRASQHQAVITAARTAGVKLIAYTSLLHADRSPLGLAAEHRATEAMLKDSGIPFVLLRNGWYSENYAASIPAARAHGAMLGAAADGRIASAARADYAEAAAQVLLRDDQAGQVHELAGDSSYTLTEFAAEIARQSGQPIVYRNLPQSEFEAALAGAGLPPPVAALLADADAGAAAGALFDDGHRLRALIGRPTTPMASTVAAALAAG
jgi:NAD(P)H dehydrogenase (quinone)